MSADRKINAAGMSGAGQAMPTRQSVLVSHARQQMSETGLAIQKFTERLVDQYVSMVPESSRKAPLRTPLLSGDVDGYYKTQGNNTKAVQRYLDFTVSMPCELEEAWVSALDTPYRDRCIFDLCSRHNVLPVLITGEATIAALADFMRNEAAAIEAMAPIFCDGLINEKDREYAPDAIRELRRVASDCAGLIIRLESLLAERSESVEVIGKV